MTLRFATVAAMLMVCMPIGGLVASHPNHHTHIATIKPVDHPWLVAPQRLLILCGTMFLMVRIDYARAARSSLGPRAAEA